MFLLSTKLVFVPISIDEPNSLSSCSSFFQLEPYVDTQTMNIHHTKHHQTYVNNINKVIEYVVHVSLKCLHHHVANMFAHFVFTSEARPAVL